MKTFTFLLLLICNCAMAQTFTFNRIHALGSDAKISGEIIVTDTVITIHTDGSPASVLDVYQETSAGNFSQYYVIFPEGSMHQIRLSLTNPVTVKGILKKNETGTLHYEHIDLFTNTTSTILYYLIPKN